MAACVYLIPTVLADKETGCLPAYLLNAIRQCRALFVENERTARRYLKLLSKDIIIDDYEWFAIHQLTDESRAAFRKCVADEKTVGIISEAGCPGVADPGQELVHIAQQMNATVKPLVGPNSILLALMASGMNGQCFQFAGYLPIEGGERIKAIRALEAESKQKRCTQIFIETPYRNDQLAAVLMKTCGPDTQLCIAADLTASTEWIKTKKVKQWKAIGLPSLHKRPAIFLLYAGD